MAIIKRKDIEKLSEKDIKDKLKDLKMELIKNRASDKGKLKRKEIKKAIARILTFNRLKSIKEKPVDKRKI